ncbi:hypothetical protein TKK_0012970 [Trichogramma kaykai]
MLIASGNSVVNIMQTLEARFGKSKVILAKIVQEIKDLPSLDSGKLDMFLIDQDNISLIASREIIFVDNEDLLLSRCRLGWTLHGKLLSKVQKQCSLSLVISSTDSDEIANDSHDWDILNCRMSDYFSLESMGIVDKAQMKPASDPPKGKIWYLPHFGVQNINKPNRVRVVFDAAAKSQLVSFNDLLLSGPDLLKSLSGVLMRFREKPIAIKSDIRDMFLKIKILEEDHDAQRFFWGEDESGCRQEYVITSMLFGAKSSPCAALYIKNKNALEFNSIFPETAKSIIENSYMDDFLESFDSIEDAKNRIRQVIEINRAANWEMHDWSSNESETIREFVESDPSNSDTITCCKEERVLVLGLLPQLHTGDSRYQTVEFIPRSLQAALLAVRLAKTIVEEHSFKIDSVCYWSDSQIVLH